MNELDALLDPAQDVVNALGFERSPRVIRAALGRVDVRELLGTTWVMVDRRLAMDGAFNRAGYNVVWESMTASIAMYRPAEIRRRMYD